MRRVGGHEVEKEDRNWKQVTHGPSEENSLVEDQRREEETRPVSSVASAYQPFARKKHQAVTSNK